MTNSAFRLVDDLAPWRIGDFEILLNGKNVIVATNPGQFYYHQRAFNDTVADSPASVDFQLHWDSYFAPQTSGGMPIHGKKKRNTMPIPIRARATPITGAR